jgi:hypothetical protein
MSFQRALGSRDLPEELALSDGPHTLLRTLQHSFFAATGLYEGPGGRKLVKVGREASLLGLPMRWLGRWLARRELAMYEVCRGIEGVPTEYEVVTPTAFARPFVEGHPLERGERVGDGFFPRLRELLAEIHARDVAFVDLQKAENVLVDERGEPCLFDFQAAWHFPPRGARRGLARLVPGPLGRYALRRLQAADDFHVLKHWRRSRPDTIPAEELERTHHPGGWIRLHRVVHNRWRALRRRWRPKNGEDLRPPTSS